MTAQRRANGISLAALALIGAALAAGTVLRLAHLPDRPMHADEAILADKLGTLVEKGEYRYDPVGYHGPALVYLSLIPARLAGAARYADLDERLLRITPAICGLLLALAPLLLAPALGWGAAVWAVSFLSVSPAFVYYSRYFIPETPLALFTACLLVFACRWLDSGRRSWALGTGLAAGLMLATKETAVLALAVAGAACLPWVRHRTAALWRQGALAAVTGFVTASALLSSFGRNPAGMWDFLQSYFATYLERGLAGGPHYHPWDYYWRLLGWFHQDRGPVFTEAGMLILAVLGSWAGWRSGRRFPRFLILYAAGMAAAYSLIPYKTPWCVLSSYFPLLLLAGMGAHWLVEVFKKAPKAGARVLLVALAGHLAWQAAQASFRYAADPHNPWVYAHTAPDVFLVRDQLEALATAHEAGRALPVQVFSTENLWPLPWYFRAYSRVEWWTGVPERITPAPVIFATPDMEASLAVLLYEARPPGQRELYMRVFPKTVYLRPGVEIRGYAAKSLWDRSRAASPRQSSPPDPQLRAGLRNE